MRYSRHLALLLLVAFVLPVAAAACGQTVGERMDDATLTARVKTTLLNDKIVNAVHITVDTNAGIVTLSGAVASQAEADRAVQLARSVAGVKDVKSQLQVGKL